MTENTKMILRPKVRFSQISDNTQNKEEVIEHCKEKIVSRENGPKIKSIVSLEKPVRIVDVKKFTNTYNKNIPLSNCNTEISTHSSDITSENIQKVPLLNKSVPKVETAKILHNTNSIKDNSNLLQLDKSSQGNSTKDWRKGLQQKGKENKNTVFKKAAFNKNVSNIRIGNSQHVQPVACEKFILSKSNNDIQKVNTTDFRSTKMIKSRSLPNITKKPKTQITKGKILNIKSVTSNVMPCYKTLMKNKISPVKKIVLRNVSGPKITTFVGPGVSRKEQIDVRTSDTNKKCVTASDTAIELAQPRYNSILCTINKLKELEQQKIVTDIDHLSSVQKNLVNGKISTVLDFPLDEAIYKNLVDLNIDEKHLPSAITRSKNPEPRQKDITPRLSDFFMPEDTKEIYEAMHIKLRTLKMDENWNAFKISDKLLEWKYSMDNVE